MSDEVQSRGGLGRLLNILPWFAGAVALAVYLFTLNHWVSLLNLGHVARAAGWLWQPEVYHPAHFLVTYPVRWLPAAWCPLALNLLSAVFATLTLVQWPAA